MLNEAFFYNSDRLNSFRSTFIVGACRSGKTTISTLLSSYKYVENSEEPWGLKIFTLLNYLRLLNTNLSKQLFLSYSNEIFNEKFFLRNVSFRKTDNSFIGNFKTSKEIKKRLTIQKNRDFVKDYIKRNKPLMIFNLTEVTPQSHNLLNFIKKSKLIYVMRRYNDVALDCYTKKWFSNQSLLYPKKSLPYFKFKYKNKIWFIPWWVKKSDFKYFIELSQHNRCLYYWIITNKMGYKSLKKINKKNYKIINFDHFKSNPEIELNKLSRFLKIIKTNKTKTFLSQILKKQKTNKKIKFDITLEKKAKIINQKFASL